ncbi:MAG: TetR/AcrR family transcriptional regulator [Alphaproteobacteria bacterium]|nr:TetR/AcrR family transcriptional regulator [Alphaproteobacteria bacterium]MBU2093561.1 TetR/AcrR family transcriptional regulator [Alphaproteobacteria bacterium]MBU2149475.1 TetR/AcrR family transcriptional regulator [Alphaproteobacteria bacterium]MBU2362036.1 TetR/AcrR family transcriptional regulator [Alphaproteobacteria bacterium]
MGDLPGRLIREARDLLEEGGRKPFNLRALAARSGITAASMYHHFASKTALLAELAALGFGEMRRALESADRTAVAGGRLRAWATGYFAYARHEPAMFALMFEPEIAEQPQVAEARAAALAVLHRIVEEVAIAQGRVDAPLRHITLAVWAAAHGAADLAPSTPEGDELIDDVIAGLEALFRPLGS